MWQCRAKLTNVLLNKVICSKHDRPITKQIGDFQLLHNSHTLGSHLGTSNIQRHTPVSSQLWVLRIPNSKISEEKMNAIKPRKSTSSYSNTVPSNVHRKKASLLGEAKLTYDYPCHHYADERKKLELSLELVSGPHQIQCAVFGLQWLESCQKPCSGERLDLTLPSDK